MKKIFIFKTIIFQIAFIISFCLYNLAFAHCPEGFKSPKKTFFDLNVCGDNNVSDIKLEHASLVLSKIIDYNRDGLPDNKHVTQELINIGATFLVVSSDRYEEKYLNASGNEAFTIVYEDEMVPNGDEFDPTL